MEVKRPILRLTNDSAHPGTVVPHDSPTLTTLSSDSSGTHGPAAPPLASTVNVPGTVLSDAALDKIYLRGKRRSRHGRGPQPGYDRNRSHRACRHPASSGHHARHECGDHAGPEPHDRTTRYDQGPVAAPSRRFSFCLSSRARVHILR